MSKRTLNAHLDLPPEERTRASSWRMRRSHIHRVKLVAAQHGWTMEYALDKVIGMGLEQFVRATTPPPRITDAPPAPLIEDEPEVPIPQVQRETVPEGWNEMPAGLVQCDVCGRKVPGTVFRLHRQNCAQAAGLDG